MSNDKNGDKPKYQQDRIRPLTEERGLKPAKQPPPTPSTKPPKQEKKD